MQLSEVFVVALALVLVLPYIACEPSSSSLSSVSGGVGRLSLRHSLKAPFVNKAVPFWKAGAGALVNDDFVRLTPAKQSRTGYLWNTIASDLIDWEATVEFAISGHPNYGGDGFAFWYAERPETLGAVYGSADYWVGLGIMFDSFNNDGAGKSPLISAVSNDGTQKYDSFTDGASQALASCSYDFRNIDTHVYAKITYQAQKLTVSLALYRDAAGQPVYKDCFEVEKLDLGVDKFFGLSAHTGDVADNHDIYSVVIRDLTLENSDIDAVRQRFRKSLEAEQAKPQHQDMSSSDFQHHLVTSLTQMLEELNLLELGQIAINEWLNTKTPQAAQLFTAQDNAQMGQAPPQSQQFAPAAIRFDGDTLQRISTLIENQQAILREIRTIQTATQSQSANIPQGGRGPSPGSAAGAAGGLDRNSPLGAHAVGNQAQFAQIREQLVTLTRRVEDVLQNVVRARNQYETLLSGDGDSGPASWTSFGMVCFCVIGIGSVVVYTISQQSSKERYKII